LNLLFLSFWCATHTKKNDLFWIGKAYPEEKEDSTLLVNSTILPDLKQLSPSTVTPTRHDTVNITSHSTLNASSILFDSTCHSFWCATHTKKNDLFWIGFAYPEEK
jgi:hypothetical protein